MELTQKKSARLRTPEPHTAAGNTTVISLSCLPAHLDKPWPDNLDSTCDFIPTCLWHPHRPL